MHKVKREIYIEFTEKQTQQGFEYHPENLAMFNNASVIYTTWNMFWVTDNSQMLFL